MSQIQLKIFKYYTPTSARVVTAIISHKNIINCKKGGFQDETESLMKHNRCESRE